MSKTLATRNEWVCTETSKGLDNPSTKSATKIQQGSPPPAPHAAATDILHELGTISRGGFEGKVICPGEFCVVGAHPHLWFPSSVSTCTGSTHVHKPWQKQSMWERLFLLTVPRMFSVLAEKAGRLCAHTASILGKQGVNRKWSLAVNPQCPETLPPARLHLIKDL